MNVKGACKIFILLSVINLTFGCKKTTQSIHSNENNDQLWISTFNKKLTDVIVSDVFSPPQTSRIYAYANLAAYESMRSGDDKYATFTDKLNGFESIPTTDLKIDPLISAITSFSLVSKKLVYDSIPIHDALHSFYRLKKKSGTKKSIIDNSITYGKKVSDLILDRVENDGYLERTSLNGYIVDKQQLGKWQPTPPAYMDAIEPNWNTIKPFAIDSAQQFRSRKHTAFSTNTNSEFFKQAIEVYEAVNNLTEEQIQMAMFWDCNPNQSNNFGHLMYNNQQISPAGHWIHITCQIAEQERLTNLEASYALAKVGISLVDSFIIAWDEKYRSNLIRPESYINQYIDPDWKPILETPPFPEHTSAHSVASKTASLMLTDLFGENYIFNDSTEIPFGLPVRKFNSFEHASDEAAVSRIYGGIHYRPAVEMGKEQGKKLGEFLIEKLNDSIDFINENDKVTLQ